MPTLSLVVAGFRLGGGGAHSTLLSTGRLWLRLSRLRCNAGLGNSGIPVSTILGRYNSRFTVGQPAQFIAGD
jgi:hypothetical protein